MHFSSPRFSSFCAASAAATADVSAAALRGWCTFWFSFSDLLGASPAPRCLVEAVAQMRIRVRERLLISSSTSPLALSLASLARHVLPAAAFHCLCLSRSLSSIFSRTEHGTLGCVMFEGPCVVCRFVTTTTRRARGGGGGVFGVAFFLCQKSISRLGTTISV